jgi:signal transduction histidine kinase
MGFKAKSHQLIFMLHNIGNPGMSVAARQGKMARVAVSQSALELNKGLYTKGVNTTASEYLNQVTKKMNQSMYDIQHGRSGK